METINQTSIKLILGCNSFELQGSETFVKENMQNLIDTIQNFKSNSIPITENTDKNEITSQLYDESINEENLLDKYKRVIAYDSATDALHIMGKVPGNNKADKTKNIALITILAKNREISGTEITEECKKQACYDPKNFSAIFKRDSINFIKTGKGQSWSLRLTVNGEEEAIKVLDVMLNERSSN